MLLVMVLLMMIILGRTMLIDSYSNVKCLVMILRMIYNADYLQLNAVDEDSVDADSELLCDYYNQGQAR